MRNAYLFSAALLITGLISCSTGGEQHGTAAAEAGARDYLASADSVSFSGDLTALDAASRKVAHRISFDCRVKDVYTATTQLERLVKQMGGIVEESRMENHVMVMKELRHGYDSLRKFQSYQTTSSITLRVPVSAIDTVVSCLPDYATFINSRVSSREDLTLVYLANSLKNKAATSKLEQRAVQQSHKTGETIAAADFSDSIQEGLIERRMANLAMLDQVNYATLHVSFSQPERVDAQVVLDTEAFTSPRYGARFADAVRGGWDILTGLLLLIARVWPLVIIGGIAGMIILRRKTSGSAGRV